MARVQDWVSPIRKRHRFSTLTLLPSYEPEGREFESPRAHHFFLLCIQLLTILALGDIELPRDRLDKMSANSEVLISGQTGKRVTIRRGTAIGPEGWFD